MKRKNNKEGNRFWRFVEFMAARAEKVSPINSSIKLDKTDIPKIALWKSLAVQVGLMKNNEDEPSINGAAIILAIAFFGLLMWVVINAGLDAFDTKDEKRFQEANLKGAARRADERTDRSEAKRAEALQFLKENHKDVYDQLPENLKTFEHRESDKQLIQENK